MAYVVISHNQGNQFWLRGTTWDFHADRADKFASKEAADTALVRASRFNHQKIIARASIEDAAGHEICPCADCTRARVAG